MAESFNLNTFLNEQATYNSRQYTAAENGKAAMEARDIARAEEAVGNDGFLGITLSKKITEIGIGPKVIEEIGKTAADAVGGIVSPFTDWLEKYEHIYDQNVYHAEIQTMGKQMFFAKQALAEETASGAVAQKFIMDM